MVETRDAANLRGAGLEVEVRRSPKRRRTVSARREGLKTVVFIPARFSEEEEQQWVDEMVHRLDVSDRRTGLGTRRSDVALMERAQELSLKYLDGAVTPRTVRWVNNQHQRWGSCTPQDGSIRLSDRLQGMPGYVLDFVLLHELAHLVQPGHGDGFQALIAAFESADRAQGYLDGFAAGQVIGATGSPPVTDDSRPADVQPAVTGGRRPRPTQMQMPALW